MEAAFTLPPAQSSIAFPATVAESGGAAFTDCLTLERPEPRTRTSGPFNHRYPLRALLLAGTLMMAACGSDNDTEEFPALGAVNIAPVANTGPGQLVRPGVMVTLNGSGSGDPDGSSVTYSWAQIGGDALVRLSDPTSATTTFRAPNLVSGALAFALTVTDADGASDTAFTAVAMNLPPTAHAGFDQTVKPGAAVTLDGSISSDPYDNEEPAGGGITYTWTLTPPEDITLADLTLAGTTTAAPTFTAPAATEGTFLTFTLTVADGAEADVDMMHVFVVPEGGTAPDPNAAEAEEEEEEEEQEVALPKPDCARPPLVWTHEEQIVGFRNSGQTPNCNTAEVAAGTTSAALTAATSELSDVTYTLDKKTYTLEQGMDAGYVAGLIVVKGNTIVLEKYGHGHDKDSTWISYGATTPVLGMLIGAAIHDGQIDGIDDLVTDHIPALWNTAYDGVTILDLLQMRSGVAWDENYASITSDLTLAGALSGPALHGYLADLPRAVQSGEGAVEVPVQPGTLFNYSSGDANLLGDILRGAIGDKATLSSYLAGKIWNPLMEDAATWNTQGTSAPEIAGCCINATLRDFARVGWLAWNDGVLPDGTRVVPEGWMRASITPPPEPEPDEPEMPAPAADGMAEEKEEDKEKEEEVVPHKYGYLMWIDEQNGTYYSLGLFGQGIVVDPKNEVVVVVQGAIPRGATKATRHSTQLIHALTAAAGEMEESPPAAPTSGESPRTGSTLIW